MSGGLTGPVLPVSDAIDRWPQPTRRRRRPSASARAKGKADRRKFRLRSASSTLFVFQIRLPVGQFSPCLSLPLLPESLLKPSDLGRGRIPVYFAT